MPLDIALSRPWQSSGFVLVRSRGAYADRKRNRQWQCQAMLIIEGDRDVEGEDHICTLEKLHFGPHLCWCGWRFTQSESSWAQPRLPSA